MDKRPHMTDKELVLWRDYVSKAKTYVEWGSGGSTLTALDVSKAEIWSIESDWQLVAELAEMRRCGDAEMRRRLHILYAPVGETREWGYPKDFDSRHIHIPKVDCLHMNRGYPSYANRMFNALSADVYFIDGRFRVACAMVVLLYNPKATVLVHDFVGRARYAPILNHYEVIDKQDTLVVLKAKEPIYYGLIERTFNEYCYDAS